MSRQRLIFAGSLLAGAALVAAFEFWPLPAPPAPPADGLSLKGKWIGTEASEDAVAFAGVCGAIADALEQDGQAQAPRIATGLQLEDLRVGVCEFRFAPRPLRDRQPHVKAAVGRFLDTAAGTSGGPIDAEARGRWVAAFRTLASAAEESVQ